MFVASLFWLAIAATAVRRGAEARLAAGAFVLGTPRTSRRPCTIRRARPAASFCGLIAPAQPTGHGGLLDHIAVYRRR